MSEKLEASAQQYDNIAKELEKAVEHYKTAANHFRNKEIPRGAAHAYAGWGHLEKATTVVKAEAINHAENSKP